MPRTSRGRQKIEMTKMSKESNLLVTFSKRRSGLFKKASELCTLCGAEIAIIVFSPGKKVFSFGHPSVEALVDRFLSRRPIAGNNPNPNPNPNPNHGAAELLEAHRNLNVRDLNMQLTNLLNQLEIEKKRGDELSKIRKASAERCWWEVPTEALDVHQLEQVKVALEELKKNVVMISEKMRLEGQGASGAPYFMGVGMGGGQSIVAFPPPVPQRGQAGVSFPPHVPPQDLNGSELGLSLTPHGYSMGYGRGGHFGSSFVAWNSRAPVIRWIPPPQGWLRCNIDGAADFGTKTATGAAVVRNSEGRFVQAWTFPIPFHLESVLIEAEAMRLGVDLLLRHGFYRIQIEIDSQELFFKLRRCRNEERDGRSTVMRSEMGRLVNELYLALKKFRQCSTVMWNYREANSLADEFCSSSLGVPYVQSWCTLCPAFACNIYLKEKL